MIVAFLIGHAAGAQQGKPGQIKGRVQLENNGPAADATISLLRSTDSALVKLALPDKDGGYEFENIKPGSYILLFTQTGYHKFYSAPVSITESEPQQTIPAVSLAVNTKALAAVTIESRKPFIERKADRFIVNVENSIVSAGSTVLNILERSPGVLVNEESGISLRGKQGVIIMIDGKPSPLSGTDLVSYLKSIPSASIDKIEIITNPSSKYDAAGNAGIINIRFKKDQRQGLNGNLSASYGQGHYYKFTGGTNINYRKKQWNLFTNISGASPKNLTRFYINRKFFNAAGNTESVFDQNSFTEQPIHSRNIKIGADYYAGKRTVIGVMLNGNLVRNSRDANTDAKVTKPDGSLLYTSLTNNLFSGKNSNAFGNLNFKHTFDSSGTELTVDLDMGRYHSKAFQDFNNQYFDATGQPASLDQLNIDQAGMITVKSVKADYQLPLTKNAKLEAGVKSSYVKTDSDIKFFIINGAVSTLDGNRSNHFLYSENVNAAYASYAKEYTKTDIQVGLRMEHTVTKGRQITTGEKFSRNYVLLFPTFFINQKLAANHQLSFSYSRRIDRPSYRQLNPFKVFVDPYTYVVGEPSLRPVLTNSFEVNYTFKGKYIATASYTKSKAAITDIFTQDDITKISYQSPANIQDFEQYNLGLTIPYGIKKWMNANLTGSIYYNKYSSPLQGAQLQNDYLAWDINSTNSFVIGKKGWAAELSGFYQSKNAWGLFIIKNLAQVSTGIQKTTKNKQTTFKLAVSDIFSTNHIAVVVKYQNMDFHTDRTWDSRVVTLSLTHRFGKNTVARARQRSTGIEDEKKRAN